MTTQHPESPLAKTVLTEASAKRKYQPPKLVCYGAVRTLTQAGGTGSNEGSSSGNMNMSISDVRAKENIVRIGNHPRGFGLYLFDYKAEFAEANRAGRQFGVMAQEVEAVMPDAVVTSSCGLKRVDYAMLGIERSSGR